MNWKGPVGTDGLVDFDGPISGVTLRRCPDCGNPRLDVSAFWYGADFVCRDCNSCWRIQHGFLFKTDPAPGQGMAIAEAIAEAEMMTPADAGTASKAATVSGMSPPGGRAWTGSGGGDAERVPA